MRHSAIGRLPLAAFVTAATLAFMLLGGADVAHAQTVTFKPDPLEITNGGSGQVSVTVTKTIDGFESALGTIHVRLVDSDVLADDLLGDEFVSFAPGGTVPAGSTVTVLHTFTLNCVGSTVTGIESSGESEAELRVEFFSGGDNFGAGVASCVAAPAAVVRVHSLLVNAIPVGGALRDRVVRDVDELKTALIAEDRPPVISTMGGSVGPGGPGNAAALTAAINAALGAADGDDLCLFFMGTHGGQAADVGADEADNLDGVYQVGAGQIRDDDFDTPFNALLANGNCGGGLAVMILACHSGELIVGANDFALAAPNVVMTSCTSPQTSAPCIVGGHRHSCYGMALIRGLTSATGVAPSRADANASGIVTASELHAYVGGNDFDGGADPQSSAPGSLLQVFTYTAPAVHASEIVVDGSEGEFCQFAFEEPTPTSTPPPSVGGIAEVVSGGDSPRSASDGSSAAPDAALAGAGAAAVVAALSAGAWYARRRWLR